ncbi:TonB-dependent receptor domain-containing protein [Polaribacter sp.]|uniref:TonB-dependent receptor n=1 Tax=Polaribacter sp. TaxID=1920175 RepID=UPI003F6A3029
MKHFLALLFLVSINSFSQSISGLVMDGEFNEPLPFANVLIKGTTQGTTTDIDGKFLIKTSPGTYTLVFSFLGYATTEISGVVVTENKEAFVNVTLKPASSQLEAVVIKTTSKKNSEASILNLQKKSIGLIDGLSIQAIKKAGDSDVAGAIKRVPGISVQGGKYVYVRGLGDRYSKTTLNGMELPGLDPDRNTIPMDIFPTNLIENIIVKKSASSEIGADFTGGTVDINLKDFSFNPQYNFNFSAGYNPDMHFNSDFIRDGITSSTDWRGKDDGARSLPIDPNLDLQQAIFLPLTSAEDAAVLTENTRKLNPTMAPVTQTSDMNYSFGFSASNGYKLKEDGDASIGYIAALGYKSQTTYFDNFIRDRWQLEPGALGGNYVEELSRDNNLGTLNNFLSTLFGVSFKSNKHKIGINFLNLQNGESNAMNINAVSGDQNPFFAVGSSTTYTERNLMTIPIYGKHTIGDNALKVHWRVAQSKSKVYDKDFRTILFETDEDRSFFQIRPNVTSSPSRAWRDLEEEGLVAKLDLEFNLNINSLKGKVNLGGSYIEKEREYNGKSFDIFFNGNSGILNGDADALLAEENIWVQSPNLFTQTNGSYIAGGFERTNLFTGQSKNNSLYLSTEWKFSDLIKAIAGLRYETFQIRYTGEDIIGNVFDNQLLIDKEDFFPNLNLIVSPNDKSNVRFAFYQTTGRPNFQEASASVIPNPVTNQNRVGNPEIQPSYIDNFDLRYEYFGEKNQMIALSVFSKNFEDPIEVAAVNQNTPDDLTVFNNNSATVLGLELEVRKNLLTLDTFTLNFNTNATFIDAKQTMSDDEFDNRQALNPDRVVSRERELQGQSPYMVNFGLTAIDSEKEIQAGLYYNVQGPTLQIVGVDIVPDVFSEPFHNLDFSASKVFNDDKVKKKITFRVKNILQDVRESYFINNGEKIGLYGQRNPGIVFSLGASFTF